jgi:hypothetical protein
MNRLVTMLPRRCTSVEAIGATATTIADAMIEAAEITETMVDADSVKSQRAGLGYFTSRP